MLTAQTFLDAIVDAPDDDAPRLVFSDWLEEHGDLPRAEFIRVQCELARGVGDTTRRAELHRRERELLLAHEVEWLGSLHIVLRRATFVRGFLERVTVHAHRLSVAAPLFYTAPIRHLVLLDAKNLSIAVNRPDLGRLNTLDLREGCTLSAKGVRDFARADNLRGVVHLILRQQRIDDATARALAHTPELARLRTLDLYDAWWDDAPVPLLSHSPHLKGLETLILGGTTLGLGERTVAAFADPACQLTNLRRLHLSYSDVGDAGAEALIRSPHLGGLQCLDLVGNSFRPAVRRALRARFGDRVRL